MERGTNGSPHIWENKDEVVGRKGVGVSTCMCLGREGVLLPGGCFKKGWLRMAPQWLYTARVWMGFLSAFLKYHNLSFD